MIKALKVELALTNSQKQKVNQSLGICRWLYNQYLAYNKRLYTLYQKGFLAPSQRHFMSAYDFDKYINNHVKNRQEFSWINDCGSKARKKVIQNAESAFKKFFKGGGFPKFKKKNRQNTSLYFPKNNSGDFKSGRLYIMIPTLKQVRYKEYGRLLHRGIVKNGVVTKKANKYFLSLTIELPDIHYVQPLNQGIGVDLGIKDFAILSDGTKVRNINKSCRIKRQEKRKKRLQRQLSRKILHRKRGEKTASYDANIEKQKNKIRKISMRLDNIRTNHINQTISMIVKREPSFVTIENLNVSGMLKNRYLSRTIQQQRFYEFRQKLESKCRERNIELRLVSRWYPSSKTCHCCGYIKKDLKLSDRTYICPNCGYTEDRDVNAALNLRDATEYDVA